MPHSRAPPLAQLAGSAAFKSKSDRKNDVSLKEVGDPGAYHPYDNTTLAAQTAKSFNKSVNAGGGSFGTSVARGSGIGSAEGPSDGTTVGESVGRIVGSGVGRSVGSGLGSSA